VSQGLPNDIADLDTALNEDRIQTHCKRSKSVVSVSQGTVYLTWSRIGYCRGAYASNREDGQ